MMMMKTISSSSSDLVNAIPSDLIDAIFMTLASRDAANLSSSGAFSISRAMVARWAVVNLGLDQALFRAAASRSCPAESLGYLMSLVRVKYDHKGDPDRAIDVVAGALLRIVYLGRDDVLRSIFALDEDFYRRAIMRPCGAAGTMLHAAARTGRSSVVSFLIHDLGMDPDAQNLLGETPLHDATAAGFSDVIEILMMYGAKVCAVGQPGKTALEILRARHCMHPLLPGTYAETRDQRSDIRLRDEYMTIASKFPN